MEQHPIPTPPQYNLPPAKRKWSNFRIGLPTVCVLLAITVFGSWLLFKINSSSHPRRTSVFAENSAVLPRVRWEYRTLTIEARNLYPTYSDYQERQRQLLSRNHMPFNMDSVLKEFGKTGWELVSIIPNNETVYPRVADGITLRGTESASPERVMPNVRLAEITFVFKRPSDSKPYSDEYNAEMESRRREP